MPVNEKEVINARLRRSTRKTSTTSIEFTEPKKSTKRKQTVKKDISSEVLTPRKVKLKEDLDSPVTPPKQQKVVENEIKSPSTLFQSLSLNSPKKALNENKEENKFENKTVYQNARKALHSTTPSVMPGRQKELEELRCFILKHLKETKSGTMYISGPPGTGKTAALTSILNDSHITASFQKVYVNCTSIKSSGAIFARIVKDLNVKAAGRSEKDNMQAIENYLLKNHKMILLVLDEIDQLDSKKQSILYTIFEWPSKENSRTVLIGIANALDLTDRILPRLHSRCSLKPQLMHFAPYSKQQIVQIFTERLKEAGVTKVFNPVALQMLAGKVAAISGDVRRALDIGRRVIELVEQDSKRDVLKCLDNFDGDVKLIDETQPSVELKQVMNVLNDVYGTTNNFNKDDGDDTFPLQQKIILCTLLLILQKAKNKDVTIGRLHDVYRKVCKKRNILAVDQAEFGGLCSLIETRGILKVTGKKEPRLHKVNLEWNQEEVTDVLNDKKLLSDILQDDTAIGKL
nr:cell division control protein 6 homolog [Onthophagus taurus]